MVRWVGPVFGVLGNSPRALADSARSHAAKSALGGYDDVVALAQQQQVSSAVLYVLRTKCARVRLVGRAHNGLRPTRA